MKHTIIVTCMAVAIALLPLESAVAYSHANRYGGSTSHSYGSTSHSSAYGTSTSHTYGEGSSHTNEYGGSTSHNYYGGTTHTNAYGGTTSGEAGYGATHTYDNGATVYHSPDAYYGYHPPAPYYPGCYDCGSTVGAAAVGAVVGMAAGAAIASSTAASQSAAASQNAYSQGYNAGATSASVANANAASSYSMGQIVAVLPAGCITPNVGSGAYYLCGNTWFSPAYGAGGRVLQGRAHAVMFGVLGTSERGRCGVI